MLGLSVDLVRTVAARPYVHCPYSLLTNKNLPRDGRTLPPNNDAHTLIRHKMIKNGHTRRTPEHARTRSMQRDRRPKCQRVSSGEVCRRATKRGRSARVSAAVLALELSPWGEELSPEDR